MTRLLMLAVPLTFLALACNVAPRDAETTIVSTDFPSEAAAEWNPVGTYLDHRCGALDCHGDVQRNLLIYGCNGLRLAPTDEPGCPPAAAPQATPAEYLATYESLIGLEPEQMAQVFLNGGQDPDSLTFVRKARGEENHKGGTLITPGDAQDQCITSWLAGATNPSACALAVKITQ